MTAVCSPQDLMFFQVGLLRATGFSGTGEAGGRLVRDRLKRTLNPGWLETCVLVVEELSVGVLAGALVVPIATGSACEVATKETVASNPMQVVVKRMCFMILADSVAGEDKTEVTFCTLLSSDRTKSRLKSGKRP
jgi:hypothetical protein